MKYVKSETKRTLNAENTKKKNDNEEEFDQKHNKTEHLN